MSTSMDSAQEMFRRIMAPEIQRLKDDLWKMTYGTPRNGKSFRDAVLGSWEAKMPTFDEIDPRPVFSAAQASMPNATASGLTERSTKLVAAAVAESRNSKPHSRPSGETILDSWWMRTKRENPDPTPLPSPTSMDSPAGNP